MIDARRALHDETTEMPQDHAAMPPWVDAIAEVVARVLGAAVVVGVLTFAVWGTVAPLF